MAEPRRRGDFPALRAITTRWDDEDIYGHVNNVVYYSYFDTAVNGYLIDSTGVDIRALPAVGLVAETRCEFLRELRFPAEVQVGLAVSKLGNSSIVYQLGLFQGDTDEPAAIGHFVHVYVETGARTSVPIPQVIREAVTPLVI